MSALLSSLTRAYGQRRRRSAEPPLDRAVLALLTVSAGERAALRVTGKLLDHFVDWNEVRVARPRDLASAALEGRREDSSRMQALLQALYENLGGLDLAPLFEMKPSEVRRWLTGLRALSREETEAVMLFALELPVIPASNGLARVLRRVGAVPRKATPARVQREVLKGLAPESYRDFYGLVVDHAACVCHEQMPDCARCKLKPGCKSKGRW
jgi:endonuclease III